MDALSQFFKNLEPLDSFEEVTNTANMVDLPSDWWIVVSDVVGSTRAIESGKYKNVNVVGASIIVAMVNMDRSIALPYIFGGDGATLAIPPSLVPAARAALLKVKELARDGFQLELRTGLIPAKDILADGYWLKVAKYKMSEHIVQTAFGGRGWEYAENLLKSPNGAGIEVVESPDITPEASFEGFECRWKGIVTRKDVKLAILVQAKGASENNPNATVYMELWQKIFELCGDISEFHPVFEEGMELNPTGEGLQAEVTVRTQGLGWLGRWIYFLKTRFMTQMGIRLMAKGTKTDNVDWGQYKSDFVANSDFKKFDGSLKMVIDVSNDQADAIEKFLWDQHEKDRVLFGVHRSREALITCLVFDHHQKHVHFVDGGDGGYAMAAKMLKAQLKKPSP